MRIKTYAFVMSSVLVLLVACGERSKPTAALSVSLSPSEATVSVGEMVEFTFSVTNESSKSIDVPVPDQGTLSFNTVVSDESAGQYGVGGHTALAANPGRRDIWRSLGPGKSLSFSFSYSWAKPGVYEVYCSYYSRFEDKPFPTRKTDHVSVVVRPTGG